MIHSAEPALVQFFTILCLCVAVFILLTEPPKRNP